jgi:hypothetical protein
MADYGSRRDSSSNSKGSVPGGSGARRAGSRGQGAVAGRTSSGSHKAVGTPRRSGGHIGGRGGDVQGSRGGETLGSRTGSSGAYRASNAARGRDDRAVGAERSRGRADTSGDQRGSSSTVRNSSSTARNSGSARPDRSTSGSRGSSARPARRSDSGTSKWWEPDGAGGAGASGGASSGRRTPARGESSAARDRGVSRSADRPRQGGADRVDRGGDRRPYRSGDSSPRGGSRNRQAEREEYELTRGSRPTRGTEIAIPGDADPRLLDPSVRSELRTLSKLAAEFVGGHLVAAGRFIDDDPKKALEHARAARGRGARIAAVREACGLAAYHAQEWAEALSELRAARRMSGDASNIAVMADCERALGRPERALKSLDDPAVGKLDPATRAELVIVVAGARRDMGQVEAALSVLERAGVDPKHPKPGSARLWYAYADALEAAGRTPDAIQWFGNAATVDYEDETDAADRAAKLL